MIDSLSLDKVLEFLKPEHFYSEAHRRIFEACMELKREGKPVDVVQVGTWLKDRERIAQVGGMGYLTEVLNAAPAVANVAAYGYTIREKARVRQLIAIASASPPRGTSTTARRRRSSTARSRPSTRSRGLRSRAPSSSCASSCGGRSRSCRRPRAGATASRAWRPASTRYDELTAGLHDGDLTIVAARPGMGKTSFVLNVAANVAQPRGRELTNDPNTRWEDPGHGVVVFSLEMPREQLANRMICSEGRVDVGKVRRGFLSQQDWGSSRRRRRSSARSPSGSTTRRRSPSWSCAPRCVGCRPSTTSPARTGAPASASAWSSSTTCS